MALKERNSENLTQGFTRRDFLKRAVQLTQASIGISLFGCDTPRQPQPEVRLSILIMLRLQKESMSTIST